MIGHLDARRRLFRAEKMCRVDEIRELRSRLGIDGPPTADGASPAAVSIGWTWHRVALIAVSCAVGFLLLSLASTGGDLSVGGAVAGCAFGLGIGVLIPALWWSRICLDGPRLWSAGLRGGWTGPTDLRTVVGYTEIVASVGRRRLFVSLLSPDPSGSVGDVDRLNFDAEATQRLNRRGPFAKHTVEIGRPVHAAGLGEYLLRHIDPTSCEFGGAGLVWKRMRTAQEKDELPRTPG